MSVGEFDDHWLTDADRQTARNTVSDNYISRVGREFEDAAGVSVGTAGTSAWSTTETSYSGISLGWGWCWDSPYSNSDRRGTNYARGNRIVGNYVHDVMKALADGGPVYTLGGQGDGSVRSVLSGNVFSNGGAKTRVPRRSTTRAVHGGTPMTTS